MENVKENAKDQNMFFKMTYIGNYCLGFKRQWRRPIRMRFIDVDLRPAEIERVAMLHTMLCGVRKYINDTIVRYHVTMNEHFDDDLPSSTGIYCFLNLFEFIFFLISYLFFFVGVRKKMRQETVYTLNNFFIPTVI